MIIYNALILGLKTFESANENKNVKKNIKKEKNDSKKADNK